MNCRREVITASSFVFHFLIMKKYAYKQLVFLFLIMEKYTYIQLTIVTIFKCVIQWYLAHSQCCATIPIIHFQNVFYHSKLKLCAH